MSKNTNGSFDAIPFNHLKGGALPDITIEFSFGAASHVVLHGAFTKYKYIYVCVCMYGRHKESAGHFVHATNIEPTIPFRQLRLLYTLHVYVSPIYFII